MWRNRLRAGSACQGGPMQITEAHKSLAAGLFFSLLSLFLIFYVNKIGIAQPTASHASAAAVAPDFFPNLICWFAFVCGMGLAVQSFLEIRQTASGASNAAEKKVEDPEEKEAKRLAFICRAVGMVMLFVFYYMTNFIGIIITSFICYLVYAVLTGERRPVRALLGTTILTTVLYVFFVEIALVPVPLGPIEYLLYY